MKPTHVSQMAKTEAIAERVRRSEAARSAGHYKWACEQTARRARAGLRGRGPTAVDHGMVEVGHPCGCIVAEVRGQQAGTCPVHGGSL